MQPIRHNIAPLALGAGLLAIAAGGLWLWLRHGGDVFLAALANFAMTCF